MASGGKRKTGSYPNRRLLELMLLMRRFEERCAQAYGLQKIGGFCHLYIGQEAVATGSIAALDLTKDYVVTAYRDHAHALACGITPAAIMAELYGKSSGCSGGKGGSMHLFSAENHMLGGNGIVGSQIPVATGVAYKIKYKKEKGAVLCFFGDGAIHQGAFHESVNLARIGNLPIVYICENNQYGMGTDFKRVSSVKDLSTIAASYGIHGKQVDGMDVHTVHDAVSEAVEKARTKGEPALLEIKTYRYRGHSMSDPAKYRSKEEVDQFRQQDPVAILKQRMIRDGTLSEEEYNGLDTASRQQCADAVQFAEESPEPALSALYENVTV